jgi:uncharacterized membrane protein YhaH (DUF805 family)
MDNSYTSNEFLFSFRGRINRAKYWYALFASSAACLVFLAIVASAIAGIFGSHIKSIDVDFFHVLTKLPALPFGISFRDPAPSPGAIISFYAMGTPIFVGGLWFWAATTVKRLHDRNWIVPFFMAPGLLDRLWDWIDDPTAALFVSAVAFGLSVWCFVEMLCRRGTRGPNRFGPDPLAPVDPLVPVDTRPGWDQQTELEFVPRSAGPAPASHVKRGHE